MFRKLKELRILPRWIIIIIDAFLVLIAISFSYILRFNFDLVAIDRSQYHIGIPVFVLLTILVSLLTKSYSGIVRYTGFQDGLRIAYTVGIAAVIAAFFNFVYVSQNGYSALPYSINLISFFISVVFLLTYRLIVKFTFEFFKTGPKSLKRVLIFGAGQSGQLVNQLFLNDKDYKVLGYIEDDLNKVGKVVNGLKIYSGSGILDLLRTIKVDELVISVQNLSISRKNELVDTALKSGVKVLHVPPVNKWIKGELSTRQIQKINIEDLLGREAINLNNYYISKEVSNKRILITGAAGSIGSEIVRQLVEYLPERLILFDQSESGVFALQQELKELPLAEIKIEYLVGDITNPERLNSVFETYKPQLVFHAAAYKHVPMMEINSTEAVLCNVQGTRILAEIAVKNEVDRFVYISTDKAVNPTNVMGASKRIGEMFVQSLNNLAEKGAYSQTKFITTRFGNVLGSNGSVIPLFKEQIAKGGPVTVTHPDITRYFMTIPEACQLVLEAAAMGKGGEIFIFDMGKSVKIKDLAEKMIRLSGFEPGSEIEIIFTGLREGEKLFEELLNDKENCINTHHRKIMIAKVIDHPFLKINSAIDEIIQLATDQKEVDMVLKMKKLVPEFISNESKFSKLDKTAG
ncbi:MAG: polysaccharide biosynthesis protein [Cyclobacteriaceae bacterium]|nr:polysaccharide biosynthesis protein [Cyclobacteriaceae bacterium]